MTMALIGQAVTSMLRERLQFPTDTWNARHLAENFFRGLEGNVRLSGDTIVVTYYNAPDAQLLAEHYSELPATLENEGVDPRIPWLCGYKIDFRFK